MWQTNSKQVKPRFWLPAVAVAILASVWILSSGGIAPARADDAQRIYVSSTSTVNLSNGLTAEDEDILVFDTATGTWDLFFDGSALGLENQDIDAIELLADGALLFSVDVNSANFPDVGAIRDSDILMFVPDVAGDYSQGTFSMYMDGSDVQLTSSGEDIDALALTADGALLISTIGNASVKAPNGSVIVAADEDLLRLDLSSTGSDTVGAWSLYFDGSDVDLAASSEDLGAAWLGSGDGSLLLSTMNKFAVSGLSGTRADVFECQAFVSGNNTSCTFGPNLFWRGGDYGFGSEIMDALAVSGPGSMPVATATATASSEAPTNTPVAPTATNTPMPEEPTNTPTAQLPTNTPTVEATAARPGNPPGSEMVIYDWNKPVEKKHKGMPRDNPPKASANGNWVNPANFYQGKLYFRVEMFSMPVVQKMQVQFCVWQDNFKREQCAARTKFTGSRGTVVTWSDDVQNMWKKDRNMPIDWSRARQIWGMVIRNEQGKPLHPKFNWGGENTAQWFPLTWRATVVVVEKGKSFSGWDTYFP